MKQYLWGLRLATFAAVTGVVGSAAAFKEVRDRSWGNSFGNPDRLGGTLAYHSYEENSGVSPNSAIDIVRGVTNQNAEASASVLGHKYTALALNSAASGLSLRNGSVQTITPAASTDSVILNQDTFTSGSACGSAVCAASTPIDLSGSTQVVDTTIFITFVPVNIVANLSYSFKIALNSRGSASKYLGLQNGILTRTSASADATAAITAKFKACTPSCHFGVSGGVDINVLSLSLTPTASQALGMVYKPGSSGRYSWTNTGPITLRTLNGRATLGLDLGFTDWTWEIYKWTGLKWSRNLWDDSGSFECSNVTDQSICQDVVN